jgi:TonB family protein
MSERDLQFGFETYVKVTLPRSARTSVHVPGDSYETRSESISDSEAEISIAEIFLANGQHEEARRRLEAADPSPRASYYRGVLARAAADPRARDFFVDALPDVHLGPRAAAQLVDLGEGHIPTVRSLLEQAAASGTLNPSVHEALRKIHEEDRQRREEAERIAQQRKLPPIPSPAPATAPEPEIDRVQYAEGGNLLFKYALLSPAEAQPRVRAFVAPYYPEELLRDSLAGEVVLDVQVTEQGEVAGIWLVSSTPDIFANLATAAVRHWNFEPVSAKIRIVLEFTPTIKR